MSSSHSNTLLKTKRERKKKDDSINKKLETQSSKSGEYEGDDDNNEDDKENSLGALTKTFLQYIKKKGGENININDLVHELNVKKRRIYDITNVLQGIGYIEKNGKNEIKWKKIYTNTKNIIKKNSLPENYLSNYNKLKQEIDELKREGKEKGDELNKYNEELKNITKKKDFSKYGYITFDDLINLSKSDKLNFVIIKATKGTVINIIDDEESKKAYLKIKKQMENGKIEQNYNILKTLENLHHIFFTTKEEKLRIFRVENETITETIKVSQNCAKNNNIINNNNLISNLNDNNSEQNILVNIKNNINVKEKESMGKKTIQDIKDNMKKSNSFNFDKNNCSIPPNIIEKSINTDYDNNNSSVRGFKNDNNKSFTFNNEYQKSNNNNFLTCNINKTINNINDNN